MILYDVVGVEGRSTIPPVWPVRSISARLGDCVIHCSLVDPLRLEGSPETLVFSLRIGEVIFNVVRLCILKIGIYILIDTPVIKPTCMDKQEGSQIRHPVKYEKARIRKRGHQSHIPWVSQRIYRL